MDNNPLNTTAQPQVSTPDAGQSGSQTMPPMPPVIPQTVPSSPGGSKKMVMIILLAFLTVAVLLGGAVFMYMRAQRAAPKESPATTQSTQVLNNLSTDINNVDIASPESDFQTVDSNLSSL